MGFDPERGTIQPPAQQADRFARRARRRRRRSNPYYCVCITAARSRSPPCRPCGCRIASTPAARANSGRSSRHRSARPFRPGRARPGCGNPGHQTINRTRAAAALPSVMGGPGWDFIGAVSPPLLAAVHTPSTAARVPGPAPARACRGCPSRSGSAATTGSDRRRFYRAAAA